MTKQIKLILLFALLLLSFTLSLAGQTENPGKIFFTVSGYVKTAADVPIQGVEMWVDNSPPKDSQALSLQSKGTRGVGVLAATTNATGYYSFVSTSWSGFVFVPEKAGYTFTPESVIIGSGNATRNFVGTSTNFTDFNNTADLANRFNPDLVPVYSNVSNGGLNDSGCVDIVPWNDEVWTKKEGIAVPAVGQSVTVSSYIRVYGDAGETTIGFATANSNNMNGLAITPSSVIGMYFNNSGIGIIRNQSYYNDSLIEGPGAGTWLKAILTITNQGNSRFDARCQLWYSDAAGVTGLLRGTYSETGLLNVALASAGTIYPYFGSTSYIDRLDNFDVQANQTFATFNPATEPYPSPEEEDYIDLDTSFSWEAPENGFIPTGYRISIGTDHLAQDVVNNVDLGMLTSYTPATPLVRNTKYYWYVTPYNAGGDAIGIPLWTFLTDPTYTASITDLPAGNLGSISPYIQMGAIPGNPITLFSYNPSFETFLNDAGLVIQLTNSSFYFEHIVIDPDLGYLPDWVAFRFLPGDWQVYYPDESSTWFEHFLVVPLFPAGGGKNGYKAEGDVDIIFAAKVDFPAGASTQVDIGESVIITINPTLPLYYAEDQTMPELPISGFTPLYHANLSGSGIVDIVITTDATWGAYRQNGNWYSVANTEGVITFDDVDFDAKNEVPIILADTDPTLPVTLSSFTATLSSNSDAVTLKWLVESETNHAGYNVLRNTNAELSDAICLNISLISEGIANGSQISYSHTDVELDAGATYYYWLESMDLSGASYFYGPLTVLVTSSPEDPGTPETPLVTELMDAFPNPINPFNPSTTIRFSLKEAVSATINIYNVHGQLIRSYGNSYSSPGHYQIVWDGRDRNGTKASSGLYFYRMQAGEFISTKKLIMCK